MKNRKAAAVRLYVHFRRPAHSPLADLASTERQITHFLASDAAKTALGGSLVDIDKDDIAVPAVGFPVDGTIGLRLGRGIQRKRSDSFAVVSNLFEQEATETSGRTVRVTSTHKRGCFPNSVKGPSAAAVAHVNSWAVASVVVTANESNPYVDIVRIMRRRSIWIAPTRPDDCDDGDCDTTTEDDPAGLTVHGAISANSPCRRTTQLTRGGRW